MAPLAGSSRWPDERKRRNCGTVGRCSRYLCGFSRFPEAVAAAPEVEEEAAPGPPFS